MLDNKHFIKNRVSIVTPVYNGQQYLGEFLDSVLAQKHPDIEMILVDDGSADHTLKIAEEYKEKFEKKQFFYRIIAAEHSNASGAINKGLPFVTGEYLIWPDSDDYLTPESISERVRFLKNNPNYYAVRSLPFYFEEHPQKEIEGGEKIGDTKKEQIFWDILENNTFISCGCYMFSSEKFFEIYPKREIPEYEAGQNFQMVLPFVYYYACPTLETKMYGVRIHSGSHSRVPRSMEKEIKRYEDFEAIADEIAIICKITTKEEIKRLKHWKYRRRMALARLQKKEFEAIKYAFKISWLYGIKIFLWNLVVKRIRKK